MYITYKQKYIFSKRERESSIWIRGFIYETTCRKMTRQIVKTTNRQVGSRKKLRVASRDCEFASRKFHGQSPESSPTRLQPHHVDIQVPAWTSILRSHIDSSRLSKLSWFTRHRFIHTRVSTDFSSDLLLLFLFNWRWRSTSIGRRGKLPLIIEFPSEITSGSPIIS